MAEQKKADANNESSAKQDAAANGSAGTVTDNNGTTANPQNDTSALPDTDSRGDTVNTYYEKVYADPADTIFWYGFGQSALQFFANVNTALGAYLSDWFCHAWDFVTGQYELVLHSEVVATAYSADDMDAMRNAGLSEQDIADITGCSLDSDGNAVVQYVDSDASAYKKSDPVSGKPTEKPSSGSAIVIPANPDETTRVDYELTYYVNNVNTANTQVLMEYGKRDELKNVYTYGNERISVETIADTFNPVTDDFETDYYLYDGRGSVANVVAESADILSTYTYDPFGNVTSGAPDFDSFYGYNAEETNPVTGLQYLRARYYDTDTGRFGVADTYLGSISQPQTLNRYAYTVNNPIMYIDSSGHFILTAIVVGAIAGAVIGATVSGVKSYKTQKATTGKVNGWTVAKDALVGGLIGGTVGAAAGAVGAIAAAGTTAAIAAGFGAAASTSLAGTVAAGMVAGAAGGLVSRVATKTLNSTASNIIQKNNLYPSAVYTQPKTPKQMLDEAWAEATDVKAMMTDAMIGGAFAAGAYGLRSLVNNLRSVKQFSCGTAENVTAQNPIDDVTPKVPELSDDVFNQADDVLENLNTPKVNTPYGEASQDFSREALDVYKYVEDGGKIYRGGTLGRSNTTDAQFWAPESPLSPGYADKYGVDFKNLDYVIEGTLKPGTDFITRQAPSLGGNAGGAIEIVTPPGAVELNSFVMVGE